MGNIFLEFEKPIAELEKKIEELKFMYGDSAVDLSEEIDRLQYKSNLLKENIYAKLTPWEITQVARHAQRPYTLDYIKLICTEFVELHGDRHFGDDPSIVAGLAKIGSFSIVLIGHQKGRDTKEKIYRNFGMPRPEGYRKALRIMRLAEKFALPIVTMVDTPGAYPGIDAEERGQSEAIGRNLYEMSQLNVPIVSIVIGEGGSGGALAISVSDCLMMMQYAVYSVISPEGCASILWKNSSHAKQAAERLQLTAARLYQLKLIDRIIAEPLGGAHRDYAMAAQALKSAVEETLSILSVQPVDQIRERRHTKLMSMGSFRS